MSAKKASQKNTPPPEPEPAAKPGKVGKRPLDIRDRIVGFKRLKASDLKPHPLNWRTHPQNQRDAMAGILSEVGYVDALMVRPFEGGYQILDGHLRAESTPDTDVPVLVVDLNDAEAAKVLATFDPLAALARADSGKLDALLRDVTTTNEALAQMLTDLVQDSAFPETGPKDASTLSLLNTDAYEPRHKVATGQTWHLGPHVLMICDVFNDWRAIFGQLSTLAENVMFVPYGGPLVPLSVASKLRPMVIVQPVEFVAATILDWWDDANAGDPARLV